MTLVDASNPFAMDAEDYRFLTSLNWRNEHSRRLAQAIGDDKLMVAFDGSYEYAGERIGCWVIGQLVKRLLIEHVGRKEVATDVHVPVIIGTWQDEHGKPLSIQDPRLVESVRWSAFKKRTGWREQRKADAAREKRQRAESAQRERRALAKELFPSFQRWADSLTGFVGREGPGGQRKFYYDGCLGGKA